MAGVTFSLRLNLGFGGRTLASMDKHFIIGARSSCSAVERNTSEEFKAMDKRKRRLHVTIAPAGKLCSDVHYGSRYTSKLGTSFTTAHACKQACSDAEHKGKFLNSYWPFNPGCFVTVNGDGSRGNCHWNSYTGNKVPHGAYRQLCDPPTRKPREGRARSYYDRMKYTTNVLPVVLKGTGSNAWEGGQVLCSNPVEGGGMSWSDQVQNTYHSIRDY